MATYEDIVWNTVLFGGIPVAHSTDMRLVFPIGSNVFEERWLGTRGDKNWEIRRLLLDVSLSSIASCATRHR